MPQASSVKSTKVVQRARRPFHRLLVIMAVVLLAAASWLIYFAVTPLEVPLQARQFSVAKGTSLRTVSHQLVGRGLLREPWSFAFLARLLGKAQGLKAGVYSLPQQVTPIALLEKFSRGDVTLAQITFIEGWTFAQMRQALAAHASVRHDSQTLAVRDILGRLGIQEIHPEGLFFPDTYLFNVGASDLQIMAKAHQTMRSQLDSSWQQRRPGLPYDSAYEALIMASIVEKETGNMEDRSMIAAVFVNRLARGMRLQTDPTVIYGLGQSFDGNLRRQDLETDTPYNTYTRAGLPPTPIALPGAASIRAALDPAPSRALYFVARGDGSSQFSDTLEEHNRAVRRFQLQR